MKTFTYRRLQCFLLLPALLHHKTCHGELSNINPGSLRGAYLDAETGLTDKQLALANWLLEQANATLDDGSWDWAPYGNQGLAQFGLTSTRYAISFTALAHALQATEATPAYSEVAEEALALAARRLEDPSVFFYWGYTGHCGPSWNQRICEAHNFSMCDEDAWLWQDHPEQLPPQGLSCPDPVGFGNIMFSAHVAQTLLLYQLVRRAVPLRGVGGGGSPRATGGRQRESRRRHHLRAGQRLPLMQRPPLRRLPPLQRPERWRWWW